MILHPPVVQMPNAKHLQHRNNIVDPTKLMTADITDEKQDLLVHEVKGSKVIAVSHLSDLEGRDGFRPVSSSDSYVPCQNLTNGKGNETVAETKGVLPLETALLKGDLGISMDKNVAKFELPKVVTSCEGASSCHEITDICVDKGVASDEKILSQTSRDSDLEKILPPDKEVSSSLMKGNSEIDSSVSNISEVPKDHCPVDPVENCLPENLVNSTQNSAAEDLRGNSSAAHGNEAEQQSSTVCVSLAGS